MNTVALDIAKGIDAAKSDISDLIAGIAENGTTNPPDWSIFVNVEPDMPASCITIIPSAGPEPEQTLDHSPTIDQTPIQIRVRGINQEITSSLCTAIVDYLFGLSRPVTINTQTYQAIQKTSVLIPLGQDEKRRWKSVQNLRVYR